ncbi:hypothetical protein VNO78_31709 [Psophocarpus tetragonolobus]|uniref:Uncharacterized protein n=1 Tax=Psophocarpus tetragonolobus TaxID=3891 RepID=A0AAN9RZH7_PSOTE
MGKYTKGMLVLGVGALVVSMWCMKGSDGYEDDLSEGTIHAVRREDPPEGCGTGHSDGGVEECTDEDDSLGLYNDVDDTFKAAVRRVTSYFHHQDDTDDSPDLAHNNINEKAKPTPLSYNLECYVDIRTCKAERARRNGTDKEPVQALETGGEEW